MSYIEETRKAAKEHVFRDFIPTTESFGSIQIVDWRNKNGSKEGAIRFLFDNAEKYLHISGDYGSAILDLHSFSEVSLKTVGILTDIGYLIGKIKCSTDLYIYDEELARKDVEERLLSEQFAGKLSDEEISERKDFISELMEDFTISGIQLGHSEKQILSEYDHMYWEWIYDAGKKIAGRVIYWFTALNMMYDLYYKEEK